VWGPVWTTDTRGRRLALRWTAHDTAAVNLNLRRLETAPDVDAVLAAAGTIGIPQQNLVCADHEGRIAWTIAGPIPRRVGWDGRLPVSWADGTCRWDGYRDPADQPRIVDPQEGRLWTANNRVNAGADLQTIGDGGYALGARARQIRDDLRALERPLETDLLAVQLDDRALMLAEWRELILAVLERAAPAAGSPRAAFARCVREDWSGRADVASVAYRLVRGCVFHCIDAVYDLLTARCTAADPDFRTTLLPFRHAVTWEILQARPAHLLPPWSNDWDDVVLEAVDRIMAYAIGGERRLADFTWGARNQVAVAHPYVRVAPWLAR
jgi:penicillin amidase